MNSDCDPLPARAFRADALTVQAYASPEALAQDAALAARTCLRQSLADQGRATAVFACATSQVKFLAALVALEGIDWSRIAVFHMDEYLGIAPDHAASFRRFLVAHLVGKVRPGTVHYLAGDASQPIDECERYARLLRAQPIDLCCLGIGENGHLAFNDPPVADFADPRWVKLVRLDDACRRQQVGEGCFPALDAVPQYALTLTVPALCEARRMLCVVPERRKAQAVRAALRGPVSAVCPASILRMQRQATLYLDAESSSLLDP